MEDLTVRVIGKKSKLAQEEVVLSMEVGEVGLLGLDVNMI